MTKFCSKCGITNDRKHNFCTQCGDELKEIPSCECEQDIYNGDKFCSGCGKEIKCVTK